MSYKTISRLLLTEAKQCVLDAKGMPIFFMSLIINNVSYLLRKYFPSTYVPKQILFIVRFIFEILEIHSYGLSILLDTGCSLNMNEIETILLKNIELFSLFTNNDGLDVFYYVQLFIHSV